MSFFSRMGRVPWLFPAGIAVAAALVGVFLIELDPNERGHYPTCPFHAWTGLWCPGCGSLRAVRALLHGDLATAAGSNVLTLLLAPFLVYGYFSWVGRRTGWYALPEIPIRSATAWTLVAVVMGFGVVRNIPVEPFSSLAP